MEHSNLSWEIFEAKLLHCHEINDSKLKELYELRNLNHIRISKGEPVILKVKPNSWFTRERLTKVLSLVYEKQIYLTKSLFLK